MCQRSRNCKPHERTEVPQKPSKGEVERENFIFCLRKRHCMVLSVNVHILKNVQDMRDNSTCIGNISFRDLFLSQGNFQSFCLPTVFLYVLAACASVKGGFFLVH